jgi:hypothetical protein
VLALFAPVKYAAAQSYWEMTPYQVGLVVAIDPQWATGQQAEELTNALLERIDLYVGGVWNVHRVDAPPAIKEQLLSGLEHLTPPVLESVAPDTTWDKLLLVAIARTYDGGCQITARDFDLRTFSLSPVVTLQVAQPALVADRAFEAVWQAFAPIAQIDVDADKQVLLRPRAGGLRIADPNLQMVKSGDLFRPIVRKFDRLGRLEADKTQPMPWTFLRVNEVVGTQSTTQVYSGLKNPFSGRRRGQTEHLAIAVRPTHGSTKLVLYGRGKPPERLAGYDIHAQRPGEKATTFLGRTDTEGSITIVPDDQPVRLLYVKGGSQLLAKLPMVPGLEAESIAEVADSSNRLQFEGYLYGVRNQVIEHIARREILMARIRSRLKAGKREEAEKLFDELRRLPTREQIVLEINEEKARYASGDAAIQAKFDRVASDVIVTVSRFLDPKPLEKLRSDMNQATTP